MSIQSYFYEFKRYLALVNQTGLWGAIVCKRLPQVLINLLSNLGWNLDNTLVAVTLKGYPHPIWMRYQSSDPRVFLQMFVSQEYGCLRPIDSPQLIVDCGANVGYSALYFLNRYPHAHLIAIEPDSDNFKLCEKNLAPYRDRVTLINAGVWSHSTGLVVCRGNYRDGLSWSIQVREAQENETPDLLAVDLDSVLQQSGFEAIDLLKMDVERSETVIFSAHYEQWLAKVKNLVIELHDEECKRIFFKAMTPYTYDVTTADEVTVCENIQPQKALQPLAPQPLFQ
jgi:FkbM family methyltransferase